MNLPKYTVFATEEMNTYGFFSEGPAGKIRKVILYQKIGPDLFNLGFGDWNEKRKEIDDTRRSNNGDRDKILATVAFTLVDFIKQFPDARIVAEGSTIGRTRLYQMGIAANWLEINESFEIKGLLGGIWEPFQRGRNYTAFLINKK